MKNKKTAKKIDGIELADMIKKGMTIKFLNDLDELRKIKSRLAKRS